MPALQRESARECVACGAAADSFCARCGLTPYCSPTCQKRDWADRHRAVCHNLVRLGGVVKEEVQAPVVEHQPKIQNPAPLRRPHAIADTQQERPRRNEDTNSRVSDGNKSSVNFRRLQDRAGSQNSRSTSKDAKKPIAARNDSNQNSPQHKKQAQNNTKKQEADTPVEDKPPKRPFFKPAPSQPVTKASIPTAKAIAETSAAKPEPKVDKPTLVPKTSQMNGNKQVPAFKAATVSDVTPVKKRVPNRYLVEELSIGDVVILSVDAKASDCKSSTGDFVCLSLHDKYCASYQMLCEDYVVDCDADNEQYKITPGDTCSYFNPTDEGWYRARCLNPTTLALIDYSAIVSVSDTDKIRQLTAKYQALPEFCCVLEAKDVQLKDNLNCTLEAKLNDGYKVSIQNVETGAALGHGIITRWLPPVEYVTAKTVIPEISRPSLLSGSRVLLVDATSAERGFVRPADAESRRAHDDVVHRALLAGRNATPLSQPPHKGQTVLSLFSDGLHYRALCKRTNVAQNKYLLEYIEYGNVEVCRDLSTMFVCPPELELSAKPTLVSMIKLTAETGEFTPPAIEYIEKLKNDEDELILTLPNGQSTAPSGSEAILKIAKNGEIVNKKVTEMCTPEWKKFQDRGGDVVEIEPLMFSDIECRELPEGPIELDVLDASLLERGLLSGCTKGDPHAEYVFTTLTSKMAEYCNSELGRQPYLPKLEELCIAQFPPYPQWCRAVVMEQPSGAGGAEVKLWSLDCGALQLVPVSLLRKMLPEFVVDIPAVVNHLEIKGFPKDVTISPECIEAGLKHLRVDQDGRGVLRVRQCTRESDGYYIIDAPDLLQAMGL